MAESHHNARYCVEVVYAPEPPALPITETLTVVAGATIAEVLALSTLSLKVSNLDITTCKVGIWGHVRPLDSPVPPNGRIEIYRPLIADPKEARRRRAG